MTTFRFVAGTLEDTDRFGAALAESLPAGTTVALSGTLGAGKTRLVQAVAVHCGIPREEVVSPTFVLCQEYHGTRSIYHFDAYRLQGDEEFQQLGPDEYFCSSGLVFIEWAERVRASLPAERLEITITLQPDDQRQFDVVAAGERLEPVIELLRSRLSTGSGT
jgi:tRNA threonylcarbamoyladenosine biosynthesis protein TsaE